MALNALALRPGGSGVQTYVRELIGALNDGAVDLVAHVQADVKATLPAGVHAVAHPVAGGARRALAGLRTIDDGDLVHGLDIDLPWRSRTPTVTTVHDLSVFDVPWAFPRRRVAGERFLVRRALRRADAVVAVSSFTAERVATLFGRDAVVTPLAAGPGHTPPDRTAVEAVRRRHLLPERFVLQLGTIEPRKAVDLLASACRRIDVPLVLGGAVAAGCAVPAGVRHLGYVDASDVPALYAAATVVAYISRYEGFGLPPVEAMACGAPVVATRVGGLPDHAGGGPVLVACDEEAVATALRDLWCDDDLRTEVAERGRRAAAALRWEDTAAATRAVYRDLGLPVGAAAPETAP